MTENELPTGGERPAGDRGAGARAAGPEHRTDRIDPTATGVDVGRIEHEIEGWGGSSMPPNQLTPDQVEHLQDRPEPIGGGETGRALHGDQGHADPVWQADAPGAGGAAPSLGRGGHRGQGSAEAPPEP